MKQDPLFMVDQMLIKLGKYLRILGYDAEWDRAARTHELITRANGQGRIFVTRNTRLPDQHPAVQELVVLTATDPVAQLRELLGRVALDRAGRLFSRCIRCNVRLAPVGDKTDIRDRVHPNVYAQYAEFYRCPSCGTVFWKGSHVRNTLTKLGPALHAGLAHSSASSA